MTDWLKEARENLRLGAEAPSHLAGRSMRGEELKALHARLKYLEEEMGFIDCAGCSSASGIDELHTCREGLRGMIDIAAALVVRLEARMRVLEAQLDERDRTDPGIDQPSAESP